MALSSTFLRWFQDQEATLFTHSLSLSLLLFVFAFFVVWFTRTSTAKSIRLPPSPPKLPIIGHLHYLSSLPHQSLRDLSQKYGPLMMLRLGYTPTLVVSSADMAREIMKTHDLIFSDRPSTTAINIILAGGKDVAFAPHGEHWRQMRKICVMDLLSLKRVQSFRFVREEEITDMVDKIKQACLLKQDVDLSELILGVTSNIMSKVSLGRSLKGNEGESRDVAKLINEMVELFGKFSMEDTFPSMGWIDTLTGLKRKMRKTSKEINYFFDEVIDEHLISQKKDDRKDLVDILLEYEKDPSSLGIEFNREHVRLLIMDMFVAGTETTYTALAWAMAELVNHPNAMEKLQQEVRRVVGRKSKVDENDLNKMDFLKCVIKETLRLHPPFVMSLPKLSTASADVQGYHVPAKTRVIINLWAIARDPKMWDKPDEFIPDRFIDSSIDFRGKDFELIPFGAGRRGCPGLTFANASLESVLANLVYWFDWEFTGAANKRKIDMTEAFGISVGMKNPLRLVPISHFA